MDSLPAITRDRGFELLRSFCLVLMSQSDYTPGSLVSDDMIDGGVFHSLIIDLMTGPRHYYLMYVVRDNNLTCDLIHSINHKFNKKLLPFQLEDNSIKTAIPLKSYFAEELLALLLVNLTRCHSLFLKQIEGTGSTCNSCPNQLKCLSSG